MTATEIIQKVFDGTINFPKTKAEIVKHVEENKESKSIPLDIVDTLRNIPYRRYNDEADFVRGIKERTGSMVE